MRLTHWLRLFAVRLRIARHVRRNVRASQSPNASSRSLLLERLESRLLLAAPHPYELSTLNGFNGYIFEGSGTGDLSGRSVSSAGDVNGDGFDDLLIGARAGDPDGPIRNDAGENYMVFGGTANLATLDAVDGSSDGRINLANLNGTTGYILEGIDASDNSGVWVSRAGDVNGDGFADLLIGAHFADPGSSVRDRAGESYVVFGGVANLAALDAANGSSNGRINLADLTPTTGFIFEGINLFDYSGRAVSSAGDVNGDGFDDLLIGAHAADPGSPVRGTAGESYVVFGGAANLAALDAADGSSNNRINLANLNGTTGFILEGIGSDSHSGFSVSCAGDVNGDGLDDLLIGAHYSNPETPARNLAGESYVVFGGAANLSALDAVDGSNGRINLTNLNGTTGFVLEGIAADDRSGTSVSGAGDVNGDGFDDLLVGAQFADPGGRIEAGEAYLVFGGVANLSALDAADGSNGRINLANLNGTTGFILEGIDANDVSGYSVSSAGDVNGDGFDDLLIAAFQANPGSPTRNYAGECYIVFGGAANLATLDAADGLSSGRINLANLTGTTGFRLEGIAADDRSSVSVSTAGDVNGDGFDDLLIGAERADPGSPARDSAGETYLVFGGNFTGGVETQVGGTGGQTLTANQGAAAVDRLIGGDGNDTLISDGGSDILRGGEGNDVLTLANVDFSGTRRLNGGLGTDTLRLSGSGLHLDLTAIRDNRLRDIEVIDLTGSGNNTLTLNLREVLNLSTHSNVLMVRHNSGDVVNIGAGWSAAGTFFDGQFFDVYTQGAATLRVQNLNVSITGNTANFTGTAGIDSFTYNVATRVVRVGNTPYVLPVNIDLVTIDGLGARDLLSVLGTAGASTAEIGQGTLNFEHNAGHAGFDLTGINLETILVDGQGGTDIVTFTGSTGDDKYFARPTSGFMLNPAFDLEAFNFEQMTGNLLTGAGDLARFFDAAGNDTVTASPTTATIVGAGFTHTANGYDTLLAQSTAGGTDTANLTGSSGDDLLSGGLGTATLGAAGVSLQMLSFEIVTSNGVSGLDIARFTGSAGNDTFTAGPTSASFVGTGFNLSTTNFDRHFATGGAGAGDVADFTDSAGNDLFTGLTNVGTLTGTGYILQATGFDFVRIRGVNGGTNSRSITNPLTYTLQQFGTWV